MSLVIRQIVLAGFLVLVLGGCGGDETTDPDPTDDLTEEEMQLITRDCETIDSISASAFLSDNPDSAFQLSLASIRALTWVEDATNFETTLTVRLKKVGVVIWDATIDVENDSSSRSPSISPIRRSGPSHSSGTNVVRNKKVLFVNATYLDGRHFQVAAMLATLSEELKRYGYDEAVFRNEPAADINFFLNGLSNYGVIIIIAHGLYNDDHTWMRPNWPPLQGIRDAVSTERLYGKLGFGYVTNQVEPCTGRWNPLQDTYHVAVSEQFFRLHYQPGSNSFPNSLIFLVSCESFKDENASLPQTLIDAGAAAVVGWDERVSDEDVNRQIDALIGKMLQGYDLGTAYADVDKNAEVTICRGRPGQETVTSQLKIRGDPTICLVSPDFIQGTVNGVSWRLEENVVCRTSGLVENPDGTQEMFVSISGNATEEEGGEATSSFSLIGTAKGAAGLLVGESGVVGFVHPSIGPSLCNNVVFEIGSTEGPVRGTFAFVAYPLTGGSYDVQGSFSCPLTIWVFPKEQLERIN